MQKAHPGWIFGAALFLGGCMVGPRYTPPHPALAPKYSELPPGGGKTPVSRVVPTAQAQALTRWWLVFDDPELNALLERAVRSNLDLQQAASRVRAARALRTMAGAGLLPEIDLTAGYNRGHGSKNVVLPFGGGGGSGGPPSSAGADPPGDPPPGAGAGAANSPFGQGGLPGVTTNLYQIGFDASWEIDLFGGARRALAAATAGVAAAEEARRGVRVSLLAEMGTTYIELRALQRRLQIARRNLAAQRDALGIVREKFKAGLATDLDVAQQTAEVDATAAILPSLEAAEREAEHALAVLLDQPPDALVPELSRFRPLPPLPPTVPVGVPSDLLRRRPDIRRAERELAQATAQIGVAAADLFPSFSLTGALGLDSSDVKHLGDWQSHYYSIAPGIRWPILDWGRIRANVRVVTEQQRQAFLTYRRTVMQALKEVEDALVHYDQEQKRRAALAAAVDASRQALKLARQRYDHGLTDYLTTLQVQRTLLQNEDTLAQSDEMLRSDLIALYKALGGGWE